MDAPRNEVYQRRAGAFEWNVCHVDLRFVLHQLRHEMELITGARRAEKYLPWVLVGIGRKFLQVADRKSAAAHDNEWRPVGKRYRSEIAYWVEGKLWIEAVGYRNGALSREEKGVSVRRRLHELRGPNITAGAAPVLNDNVLAEALSQPLGECPSRDVGAAAWGERRDERDGPIRLSLAASGYGPGCNDNPGKLAHLSSPVGVA